jgi:hypothetical protein
MAHSQFSGKQIIDCSGAPYRSVLRTYLSFSSSRSASGPNSSSGTEKDVSCRSKKRPETSRLQAQALVSAQEFAHGIPESTPKPPAQLTFCGARLPNEQQVLVAQRSKQQQPDLHGTEQCAVTSNPNKCVGATHLGVALHQTVLYRVACAPHLCRKRALSVVRRHSCPVTLRSSKRIQRAHKRCGKRVRST